MKKVITLAVLSLTISLALLLGIEIIKAQTQSDDAIAFRIISNPEHYSAARWYQESEFTGSPQSILVDGYEAVRDGRTVYVNAANIVTGELFTNIYLISYNQEAETPTVDIFSEILNHWRFNSNLVVPGNCNESSSRSCLIDPECPLGEYCDADKARVVRDTRRLADLSDIETLIDAYVIERGRFPAFPSGSYLPHRTLSVWPSWQNVLGQLLGSTLPVDPINKMGPCPGYNADTCWDDGTSSFVDPNFNVPAGSRVYKYSSDVNGADYLLCAVMESGLVSGTGGGACPESEAYEITDSGTNNAPILTAAFADVYYPGQPFEAGVYASDQDGDILNWSYTAPGAWPNWSAAPVLADSGNNNQKRISAARVGDPGFYTFTITVDDGRGGSDTQSYTINVEGTVNPVLNAVSDQNVVIGNDLSFTIVGSEANLEYPLSYDIQGGPGGFNSSGALNANLHDWDVSGLVIDRTGAYVVSARVTDTSLHHSQAVNFTVNVINNPPNISSTPITSAVGCRDYTYQVVAQDPDGHNITYFLDGINGLEINAETGLITGQPLVPAGNYTITVTVQDEYFSMTDNTSDAETKQEFTLAVSDEVYTVSPPSQYDFYVGTQSDIDYHFQPTEFIGHATKSTDNQVIWSMTTTPSPLLYSIESVINPASGLITMYTYDNSVPIGGYTITGNVSAVTPICDVQRNTSFTTTVYPNAWCGDGIINGPEGCDDGPILNGTPGNCDHECSGAIVPLCGNAIIEAGEDCEAPGSGTSHVDQWDCINCRWQGGWCGDGTCNMYYESWFNCPLECQFPGSDFTYCTSGVDQPFCYPGAFPNPRLNWDITSIPSEYCDCDGIPPGDCPLGTPCSATAQAAYVVQVDNNSDFSSPELDTGVVASNLRYYIVDQSVLQPGTTYWWRVTLMDSVGTWGGWANCDFAFPFTVNNYCP